MLVPNFHPREGRSSMLTAKESKSYDQGKDNDCTTIGYLEGTTITGYLHMTKNFAE